MASKPFITLDAGRMKADISRMKGQYAKSGQAMITGASRGMTLFAEELVALAQDRLEPQTRSGALRASGTVADVRATRNFLENQFGFNKDYAAQRDMGGTIVAKGRMLAIPLEPILTSRGIPRYSSPREEPDLELVVLGGKVFLVKKVTRKSGERRFADFHWLLVRKVEQKGSHYFSGTVKDNASRAPEVIGTEVRKALAESIDG